mmetsp:Transcript_29728/g.54470  ORF Transcript_29728/g.54470 Transcript_29728/m.54470 type:complete len:288 (-) Transcript_29728:89-952(-)
MQTKLLPMVMFLFQTLISLAIVLCSDARATLRGQDIPVQDKKHHQKRQKMDEIEVMRAGMCLKRDALLKHDKCIKWFVKVCETKSSGNGSCDKLWDYLANLCSQPNSMTEHKMECTLFKEHEEKMGANKLDESQPANKADSPVEDAGDPGAAKEAPKEAVPIATEADSQLDASGVPAASPDQVPQTNAAGALVGAEAKTLAKEPKQVDYSKKDRKLPEQGYDEHSKHKVKYNGKTNFPKDWQKEWPRLSESKHQSINRICDDTPDNEWCRRNQPPKKTEKSWWQTLR